MLNRITAIAERRDDFGSDLGVIFDQQQFHDR
jgi:hypothetical protein